MGIKSGPRNIGPGKYLKIWSSGTAEELAPAMLKEASRQITEMENWMKEQEDYDPQGMLFIYEDEVFPLIKKAIRYRYQIYNLTRKVKECKATVLKICHDEFSDDPTNPGFMTHPEVVAAREEWADLEHDQMGYVWRIKKIHTAVKSAVRLQLAPDEVDPFAEYEYDPAKS